MDIATLQPGKAPRRGERELAFANRLPESDLVASNGSIERELLRLPYLPHRANQIPVFFIHCRLETESPEVDAQVSVTTKGRQSEGFDPFLSVASKDDGDSESVYEEALLREHEYTTGAFMNLEALSWVLTLEASNGTATLCKETTVGILFEVA